MRADQDVADFHRRESAGGEVFERVKIAERLGHLPAIDEEVRDVEPVRGEVAATGALALGDFVFVVRENQIDAAGVEVERLAEVFLDHRRTFEMPARAAFAPRRGPEIVAILGLAAFPEDEVREVVFFVFVRAGSGVLGFADVELALVEAGQAAVAGKGGDFEIHRTVVRSIGVALFHQRLDHRDLLRDVLDGARLDVRREQAELLAVGVEFRRPAGGEFLERLAGFLGIADGFVVHIGDVADMERADSAGLQGAAQHVLEHESAEIPDVRGAVNGGAAAVKSEARAVDGAELAFGPGERVKKPHRRGLGSGGPGAKSNPREFRLTYPRWRSKTMRSVVKASRENIPGSGTAWLPAST